AARAEASREICEPSRVALGAREQPRERRVVADREERGVTTAERRARRRNVRGEDRRAAHRRFAEDVRPPFTLRREDEHARPRDEAERARRGDLAEPAVARVLALLTRRRALHREVERTPRMHDAHARRRREAAR